jgi:hypothetical protein
MTQIQILTSSAVGSWKQVVGRIDQGLAAGKDEDLQKVVAPGRNRVFYLIGHLAAVHDRMLPLLGLGERLHPELDGVFLDSPDKPGADGEMSAAELKKVWAEVNGKLTAAMEGLPAEAWLERHASVSVDDFAKDPLRNRLAVLLSRTNHVSFHAGQIRLTV